MNKFLYIRNNQKNTKMKPTLGERFFELKKGKNNHAAGLSPYSYRCIAKRIDQVEDYLLSYWNENRTFEGMKVRGIGNETIPDLTFLLENRKKIPGLYEVQVWEKGNRRLGERFYGNEEGIKISRRLKIALKIATHTEPITRIYRKRRNLNSLKREGIPIDVIRTLESYLESMIKMK